MGGQQLGEGKEFQDNKEASLQNQHRIGDGAEIRVLQ